MKHWLLLLGVLADVAGCRSRSEEMLTCAEICGPGNVKAFGYQDKFFTDEPVCTCWSTVWSKVYPDAGAR